MPTIDQLQAATASSDTDELMTTQSGSARKVTRAQLLAGLQPTINVPPGALLGNSGTTTSGPLSITVGSNLTLANGTISAPAPFVIASLPAGATPSATDLVPLSQSGTAGNVTYGTFLSGLTSLAGFDASPLQVTANGTSTPEPWALFSPMLHRSRILAPSAMARRMTAPPSRRPSQACARSGLAPRPMW